MVLYQTLQLVHEALSIKAYVEFIEFSLIVSLFMMFTEDPRVYKWCASVTRFLKSYLFHC